MVVQPATAPDVSAGGLCVFPLDYLDGPGDVVWIHGGISAGSPPLGRPANRALLTFSGDDIACAVPGGAHCHDRVCGLPRPDARHDYGPRRPCSNSHLGRPAQRSSTAARGLRRSESMSQISRRKLITTGLVVTAGASGIAVAAKVAQRYG